MYPNHYFSLFVYSHNSALIVFCFPVDVATGVGYLRDSSKYIAIPIITLIFFCLTLAPYVLVGIVYAPIAIYKLLRGSGNFAVNVGRVLDPFEDRIRFTPWFLLMVENLGILLSLIALCASANDMFSTNGSTAFHSGFEQRVSSVTHWHSMGMVHRLFTRK